MVDPHSRLGEYAMTDRGDKYGFVLIFTGMLFAFVAATAIELAYGSFYEALAISGIIFFSSFALGLLASVLIPIFFPKQIGRPSLRRMPANKTDAARPLEQTALVRALAGLAAMLAGSRHVHLREAWAADLYGDPDTAELPNMSRRLKLAAGDVVAALRCRLDDAVIAAWRPADALFASYRGSRMAIVTPIVVAVGLVLGHEGFYGLITNADNLGVIATAPYLTIKGLRKYRQIPAPKRPERKTSPADGAKR